MVTTNFVNNCTTKIVEAKNWMKLQKLGFMHIGSGELEFEEFVTLASRFMVEEDAEALQQELKEAFRLYDKAGKASVLMKAKLT